MEIKKNIGKIQFLNFSPSDNFPPVKPHTFFSCYCIKVSPVILGKKSSLDTDK